MANRATPAAEKVWIANAQAGNPQAFAKLIETYQNPVYNLCYRMLGQAEEAEDAAQETFLRAYTRLHQFDNSRRFLNWILTIASHHCIDRLRKRRAHLVSLQDVPLTAYDRPAPQTPESIVVQREQAAEVQQWLNLLDPEYRMVLILLYWYGFSYKEIAEIQQCSIAAVKSRLHRARKKLASLMQPQPNSSPQDSPAS